MLALYPPFLAAALRTRLTRPFSGDRVRIVLGVAALTLCAVVLWGPIKLGGTLLYVLLSVLFGYALIASVHAWHTASGLARSRAGIFAIAFGVRDICWGIAYGIHQLGNAVLASFGLIDNADIKHGLDFLDSTGRLLLLPEAICARQWQDKEQNTCATSPAAKRCEIIERIHLRALQFVP